MCVLETTIGCSTAGITRCSWKGTVGVVWRGSLIKQNIGTVIDVQTVFSPQLQQHWCTRHSLEL